MGERIFAPLIVGITGKRELNGKHDEVRSAMREAFAYLDRSYRHTPKILLTALADGADTIAAEEALRLMETPRNPGAPGCTWQVVAMLPLCLDLYLQDFDADGQRRLRDLCARIPTQELPPLRRSQPGRPLESGAPFNSAELVRANGNPDRSDHYEQVGLFIAEKCGLLIAVMDSDEPPARIGGTSRIVEYRVAASLDARRRDILRRSQVLAPLTLDGPQPGPAWVIDLRRLDRAKPSQLAAVEQWEPLPPEHRPASHRGHGAPTPIEIRKTPLTSMRHDMARLRLATGIEGFNDEVARVAEAIWRKDFGDRTAPDTADASFALRRLRSALSLVQGEEKRKLTCTARWLAALFVAAVVLLETHVEFNIGWALYAYASLFLVILLAYAYARRRRFQQHAEDYRAVAEALRVQLVWWDAGLYDAEHRVDRTYLKGTTGSLAGVRIAVRHAIDSMLLTRPDPEPRPGAAQQWIEDQIGFFRKRIEARHTTLSHVEDLSWFLFIGSFGMAAFLAGLVLAPETIVCATRPILARLKPPDVVIAGFPALLGPLFLRAELSRIARTLAVSSRIRSALELFAVFVAIGGGCVASIVLFGAAVQLVELGAARHAHPGEVTADHYAHMAHRLIIIAMIGIAALAGALRYYVERLSMEHELFSYRDALVTFTRAQNELSELDGDASPAAQARRREILIAVGKEALEESEAWIRAHRLRPLEPVVGG
jgi:hypothetical protein